MVSFTTIALIAIAATAVVVSGALLFLQSKADSQQQPIRVSPNHYGHLGDNFFCSLQWEVSDFDDAPPVPIFSKDDSKSCKTEINDMHSSAVSTYEYAQGSEQKLNDSFQQILDRQERYGVELVNNTDFEQWAISDWDQSWMYEPNSPVPTWSDYERANWNGEENLRTLDQVNDAIFKLFWWRETYALEFAVVFRRQLDMIYIPPLEPGMCSDQTSQLYDVYVSYVVAGCCDSRPINYYPLLDRIIQWMDTQYGGV